MKITYRCSCVMDLYCKYQICVDSIHKKSYCDSLLLSLYLLCCVFFLPSDEGCSELP